MTTELNVLAKNIIEGNQYLALGTVSNNVFWVSPLAYSYDENWNFYFVSLPSSKHCVNLSKNGKVSFAIYDSHQGWGTGVGLQIEGIVEKVNPSEFSKVTKIYFTRKYPCGNVSNDFADGLKKLLDNQTYFFYKITPIKFWLNNPDSDIDERVKVKPQ